GAVRMLTQLKHQFDIIDRAADFDRYELLILPDAVQMDDALVRKLRRYRGAILATGLSGLSADGSKVLLRALPIRVSGMSPFQTTYIRFARDIATDVPPSHHVMYERGVRVTPAAGAKSLAKVVEPYFD